MHAVLITGQPGLSLGANYPRLLWYHYTRLSPIITRAQSFLPSTRLATRDSASVTGPVRFNERDRAEDATIGSFSVSLLARVGESRPE